MQKDKNNLLKQEKIRKLKECENLGVDPYPHLWKIPDKQEINQFLSTTFSYSSDLSNKRTNSSELKQKFSSLKAGEKAKDLVHIAGRLIRKRPMGKAAFFNIQDASGEFQNYIRREDFLHELSFGQNGKNIDPWKIWKLCDIGDILGLSGIVFRTQKGELSLKIQAIKLLCKSLETLPEKYHGLKDKELKYRFRHLDLIMDQNSKICFQIRSKIIYEIRQFMHKKGYIEVETPVLQAIYGGAMAQPFETYFRRLNQKMYLRVSPEIYLKKLIVGGFEKVFEIGKNFRNEGLDRSHNPEFTMMEYYSAYTDYRDQMKQFEELICYITEKVKEAKDVIKEKDHLQITYQGRTLDLSRPWFRLSPQQFENLLLSRSRIPDGSKPFSFHHKGKTYACEEFFKEVKKDFKEKKSRGVFVGSHAESDFNAYWEAFSSCKESESWSLKEKYQILLDYLKHLEPEENFEKFENTKTLSEERLFQLKTELSLMVLEITVEKYIWDPVFIIDFPKENSPLTKAHRDKPQCVERFEPYIAGMEIGNAYTELNDPIEQRKRLKAQTRWSDDKPVKNKSKQSFDESVDESFLHALEVGMPPTGGVGLGIERLVMILTNQNHIKNSMLFPMLREKQT